MRAKTSLAKSFIGLSAFVIGLASCTASEDAGPNAAKPNGNSNVPKPATNPSEGLNQAAQAELQALTLKLDDAHALNAAALLDKHKLEHAALSYDPKSAEFLDRIQASALALDATEQDKLGTNGFVISSRHGFATFVRGYAEVYAEHLPVYISADTILEAVHSSYDGLLLLTESNVLIAKVTSVLEQLHTALASHADAAGAADLDVYLAVARSLLGGSLVAPVAGGDKKQIDELVAAANAANGQQSIELFGVERDEDMSQFTPRGHYADDETMQRYFRAMMWLGRIDFRLIETQSDGSTVLRRPQVDAALLLGQLQNESVTRAWTQVDHALSVFVGERDYMALPELDQLATDLGGYAATGSATDAAIEKAIIDGGYGMQRIASHIMVNDGATKTLPLNRSFALFGQRYVLDSHVFSQVVYDRTSDMRLMPNPLDVAYAALGNDSALPLLKSELEAYPQDYPGMLEGARVLSDAHADDYWTSSLYTSWLSSLRALSPKAAEQSKPADAGLPQVAATEAWGRRILNTQLGSWSELRHDTLLYAKQSYTGSLSCEFPDAYVDPYPDFYANLVQLAQLGRALSDELSKDVPAYAESAGKYFENLEKNMTLLQGMAQNERDGVAFTDEQMAFINNAVRVELQSVGCTSEEVPDGWLSDLYLIAKKSIEFDPTIADVHTQPTDAGGNPVGNVLHVGTSYPRMLVTTVDTCKGPRAYVGVAFAYHEITTSNFERLTDEAWAKQLDSAQDVEWMSPIVAESTKPEMMAAP
ncbi:MAG TPA: DUF3160 domain-containing protein [Polyangiaceae bacterium]|nr:DUF3160 domain-containing protein [Polyangiaceae bacterium]